MKRICILLSLILLVVFSVSAEEMMLINFSELVPADGSDPQQDPTYIDFRDSIKLGAGFSQDDLDKMYSTLSIENWDVELASSSATIENNQFSLVKAAQISANSQTPWAGEYALGVRVHFPNEPYNSWAMVKPPFEIPFYYDHPDSNVANKTGKTGDQFVGYGVVKNVGVIKSISVEVFGQNFPHRMGLVLKDQNNVESTIMMSSSLEFQGWRKLVWENPNYIKEVRDRQIAITPLYPNSQPSYKLVGIIYYKAADDIGGDFINYVKHINVTYDKASLDQDEEFTNEDLWGILTDREESRRAREFEQIGERMMLELQEDQKQHKD